MGKVGIFGGRQVMVDLETLALGMGGAIVQIGAVAFYPDEPGREFERFNTHVSMASNFQAGRSVDPNTLLWWMDDEEGAGPEARRAFVLGQRSDQCLDLGPALLAFQDFCKLPKGRRSLGSREEEPDGIWGHGPVFDVGKLESAYDGFGWRYPWGHRTIRDTRTILEATGIDMGSPEGGGHIAVVDADHQARVILEAIAVLKHHVPHLG